MTEIEGVGASPFTETNFVYANGSLLATRVMAIAPEGTRSLTPHVGRFKKGAFHIAMQAKVPIVPIVFRNALDALPKDAMVVRPTTVEAVVLKPISTARWSAKNLDANNEKVRQRYVEILDR